MSQQNFFPFMLCVCLTSGLVAGCDSADEPPDDTAARMITERDGIDLGIMPSSHAAQPTLMFADSIAAPVMPVATVGFKYEKLLKKPKAKLVKDWIGWVGAQPWSTGPVNDPTGASCAVGQDGPVWFLAGTTGGSVTRECEVPAGKELFLPLVNTWVTFFPESYPSKQSVEEVLPDVAAYFDLLHEASCGLTLRVDGVDLRPDFETLDADTYIEVLSPFEIDHYEGDNWCSAFGLEGGVAWTNGMGHYALLKALPPGDHVIEFGGSRCGDFAFEVSATYLLHVVED